MKGELSISVLFVDLLSSCQLTSFFPARAGKERAGENGAGQTSERSQALVEELRS